MFLKYLCFIILISYRCLGQITNTAEERPMMVKQFSSQLSRETRILEKYVVSVRLRTFTLIFGDELICAGALLTPKLVLTSAKCLMYKGKARLSTYLSVVAGTPDRLKYTDDTQRLLVKQIVIHKKYVAGNRSYNIGLLKLYRSVYIDNITTALMSLPMSEVTLGTSLLVVGWGRYYKYGPKPGRMIFTDLIIKPKELCTFHLVNFSDNEICGLETEADLTHHCISYRGGMLIQKDVVVGFGMYAANCLRKFQPERFSSTFKFLDWIAANAAAKTQSFTIIIIILCKIS